MKAKIQIFITTVCSLFILQSPFRACAATTIDPCGNFAYGANVGWMDWCGNTNDGVVIGEYVCSGCIYSANLGWISLGAGSPANGVQYQNKSAADSGVNHDGVGNLRGYAYSANAGWISFETNGAPKINLLTGELTGHVWSANCGWISLSNSAACLKTKTIAPGADSAHSGLPDAWQIQNFDRIGVDPNADPDHDGMSNLQEYLAATDPNNGSDNLRIIGFDRGLVGDPTRIDMQWTSKPTRFYTVQGRATLDANSPWLDLHSLPWLGINNVAFDDSSTQQFYRIQAVRPLVP